MFGAPKTDRTLLLILLISIIVQAFVLTRAADIRCQGDACRFLSCARSLINGKGWVYGDRWDAGHTPPLYVLFVAAHLQLFNGSALASKITQLFLVAGMGAIAYRVARSAWGRRAGLWAAALVAFYPPLIAYAHYNYSEVLYTFLLLLAFSGIVAAQRGPAKRQLHTLVATGVVLGLATLTRDVTWYLTPFVAASAAWMMGERPRNPRASGLRFAAVVVPVVLVVLPWVAYNMHRFGSFLLLSTNAGNVLYRNQNVTPPENYDWRARRVGPPPYPGSPRPRCGLENPVENYRCEMAHWKEYMLSHPDRVVERAWPKLKALANPASFPVRFLRQGRYGPVKDSTVQAVTLLTVGPFVIVTLLAVAALWLGPRSPERSLTALILGFFLAVFAITATMA